MKGAITKELGQLHDISMFVPIHNKELMKEQRQAASTSCLFLKEKSSGQMVLMLSRNENEKCNVSEIAVEFDLSHQ